MRSPIPGYESYTITEEGKVYNKHGRQVHPYVHESGYLRLQLRKEHKTKPLFVHKLVALTFIPDPGDLPNLRPIDGNKRNLRYSNWERYQKNKISLCSDIAE